MLISNRVRLHAMVVASPGIHLRELQRLLAVSFSTVRHHVRSLEREGFVVCEQTGKYTMVFPSGFSEVERSMLSSLRAKSAVEVLRAVVEGQGGSNKGISESTGLSKSAVSRICRSLTKAGILETVPSGGSRFVVSDVDLVSGLLSSVGRRFDRASRRYEELWEF